MAKDCASGILAAEFGVDHAHADGPNDNPRTTSAGFDSEALEGGVKELKENNSNELGSDEFPKYRVHIPLTPNNQPSNLVAQKAEEQYETGGFNSMQKRAHLMYKVIDSNTNHPQMAGAAKGISSSCAVRGCDGKVMSDERGDDILPCECGFKICRDCYNDVVKAGDGRICPGCKEQYINQDGTSSSSSKVERSLSTVMKPTNSMLMMSQSTGEFDRDIWLYGGTKGTYGYGNAVWPKEGMVFDNGKDDHVDVVEVSPFVSKPWRPLTRKLNIPSVIINPYRFLIFIRMVVLGFFLTWRISHPNKDAVWLWGMSVVCEIWFTFSWILDQLPKLCPVNRANDLNVLTEKFETPTPENPTGKSDLPGIDIFVTTADPEKEPPLVTANTILSILATDYPVEKLACYVSDDGGALLTFEAMAEAATFANIWVPFCRKHEIEPRSPEAYFNLKNDPYKNKVLSDFVKDRRRVKREYDEFKVRINGLPDSIRRRSDVYNAKEESKAFKEQVRQKRDHDDEPPLENNIKIKKATCMADGTHWTGTWMTSTADHSKGDHEGIIQVMLDPPRDEPLCGTSEESCRVMDLTDVDIRLPMLVYVSREKRPGYDHNKKAGAMNALVRASAIMSNGAFILNLDCDHYIYNSEAMREGMCFMMDRGGDRICYVQFPQRFEGIDHSDRYANRNTVFFDGNMRALDGLQGPFYVGTGCLFRRVALYGFDPPRSKEHSSGFCCFARRRTKHNAINANNAEEENKALRMGDSDDVEQMSITPSLSSKMFGNSELLIASIPVAEYQGRPLADHPSVKHGRPLGALTKPRDLLDAPTVVEARRLVSCGYEDKSKWGQRVGWIYGSVTEDVVTGYRMHNRGWKSVYCVYLLTITITLCALALLEVKWAGIELEEWWRNEQFWLIGGTSAHLAAVFQGLLKVIAGLEISFTLTSKSAAGDDEDDEFADLYIVKWTSLMIPPIVIIMVNMIAILVGISRTIYSPIPQWSRLLGGVFFSFWVLAHLYPFAKGLMGKRGKTPTIVIVWSGLIAITISLLWLVINPPAGTNYQIGGSFQFP